MNQSASQPHPESPTVPTPNRPSVPVLVPSVPVSVPRVPVSVPEASASIPAIEHPVFSRLIEEVRNEVDVGSGYDRVHNRHNRGSL